MDEAKGVCSQPGGWPPGEAALDLLVDRLRTAEVAAERVLLTAPAQSDGDSVGSQLALRELLLTRFPNLQVAIINDDVVPRRYRILPGADVVRSSALVAADEEFQLAIVLDGSRSRLQEAQALFDRARTRVLLDHHALGDEFPYDIQVADAAASSTAELVDRLRRHPGVDVPLTASMAANLYCAIVFDTGYLRHPGMTPTTVRLVAELMETGIDFTSIGERTLLMRTRPGMRLLGWVLDQAVVAAEGAVILGTISRADLEASGATEEDREGLIDTLSLVEGCQVAVLLSETTTGPVRCSLRSRSSVDVAALARRLDHGGGGHRAAAGCTLTGGDLGACRERVLLEIEGLLR